MQTVLLTFLFFLVVIGAMSIGVIFGRKPISGSCGGIAALDLGDCEICGGDPSKCDSEESTAVIADKSSGEGAAYYDAAKK